MELTLDQALQKGVEAHKAGKAQEADRYYTAILKANPKHSDANHNMGVLAVGVDKVEAALPFFKTALEVNPNIAQYWLSYIDALIKLERIADAKVVLEQAKSKGVKGDGFDRLEQRMEGVKTNEVLGSKTQEPPQEKLQSLIKLYTHGQFQKTLDESSKLLGQFSKSVILHNIIGAANKGLGRLDAAIDSYKKALSIKPNYAEAYYNMANTLKEQGKQKEAIEAFNKAISMKPDYVEAYNNMGLTLHDQEELEEAIEVYKKALFINPDYAEALNNMGNALKEQGKPEEAIEAFTKAISIKPDYAEAYNNMGSALQDQGKLEEAIEAFNKTISLQPDYAETHRNLSTIKKYTVDDKHFINVKDIFSVKGLTDDQRCSLSFALAKMHEDIGELDKSFNYLTQGNALRKKLLNYSIKQDNKLFLHLKEIQPILSKNELVINELPSKLLPIFILGMPRSGTTIVEQIISSHSEVFGAGELKYVGLFGKKLVEHPTSANTHTISEFIERYLSELSKISYEKYFITDKMPHNFLFIPLICAALPEAKIIHVQRNAAATCWSNYKQYFRSNGLGYCYDLKDLVAYYHLYIDLMNLWQSKYSDRIYNLNYEKLTTQQEIETRKLVEYIGLDWEEACLSPHKNKRSVRTASQQQVRQQVYQQSSETWRKYQPYLNAVFDRLPSS